jgi:hemerythrin-like domain-containing protein
MQPLRIGRAAPPRAPGQEDVVDLLLACHARIRHFTALAQRVLDAHQRPTAVDPAQIADAARSLVRYFGVALPLHVADEDVSLAHRFAVDEKLELPAEVAAALGEMSAEHLTIDRLLDALVPAWTRVGQDPAALDDLRAELAPKTAQLASIMAGHLAAEEATIFPWMRATLTADVRTAILAEMRARRADGYLPENGTL